MTNFILFGIVLLASATLYAGKKKGSGVLFDKICDAYLLFVILHALFAFIVRLSFVNVPVIDIAAPFVLGYGPFFFIGLKSLIGKFNKKYVYLHFTPLFLFSIVYFILISDKEFRTAYLMSFYITQYAFVTIGLLGYAFWAFMLTPAIGETKNYTETKQLIKTCAFSLGIMGLIFAIVILGGFASTDDIKGDLPGITIYTGIFISVVLAFIFRVNNLVKSLEIRKVEELSGNVNANVLSASGKKSKEDEKVLDNVPVSKYNKSALSVSVFEDYKNKLDKFINVENVYLDNELTLEALAKKMRMPMHHLTQLFNVYLGENFNQYINRFRVDYACELLLENDGSLSIEQIAFNSGFNSKVSFNRHFKNITGYTPKEYTYVKKENRG